MRKLAHDLEQQGNPLPTFASSNQTLLRWEQEWLTASDAPHDSRAQFARGAPVAGKPETKQGNPADTRPPPFRQLDASALVSEWMNSISRETLDRRQIALLQNPVQVLTSAWLQDLALIAQSKPVVFFFDTFEYTLVYVQDWLLGILAGSYGQVSPNILWVVSGRANPDVNKWIPFQSLSTSIVLEPFTEQEARRFLARNGIAQEQIVQTILAQSERLPLLLAMLAAGRPTDPEQIGDATGTAVERFLKWIQDPVRRRFAVLGALPRKLNRDVVEQVKPYADLKPLPVLSAEEIQARLPAEERAALQPATEKLAQLLARLNEGKITGEELKPEIQELTPLFNALGQHRAGAGRALIGFENSALENVSFGDVAGRDIVTVYLNPILASQAGDGIQNAPAAGQDLFEWLKSQPFVEDRGADWIYSRIVRSQMLRQARRESLLTWRLLHRNLARVHGAQENMIELNETLKWRNPSWQFEKLCKVYVQRGDLESARVPIPRGTVFPLASTPHGNVYPAIVKPVNQHSSIGITRASLVENESELRRQVMYIHEFFGAPALVEEYIDGRELTVALIGDAPSVLPGFEIVYNANTRLRDRIFSYEQKFGQESDLYEFSCPAEIDGATADALEKICRRAFCALQCRDYARTDVRLRGERIYLVDANVNPELDPDSFSAWSARAGGLDYGALLERIVQAATRGNPTFV